MRKFFAALLSMVFYILPIFHTFADPLDPINVFDMAEPNVVYVAITGDDSNNGSSFAFAKKTVKSAIDYANTNATVNKPIAVKIGVGVFSENNPIQITNNYVSIKGESTTNTIIEPQNDGQPVFDISATLPAEAANIEHLKIRGDTDFRNTPGSIGMKITGDGFFLFQNIITENTDIGISFGHGTISYPTISIVAMNNMGPRSSNTCIQAVGDGIGLIGTTPMAYCTTGVELNDSSYVQLNNWRSRGGPVGNTGTGLVVNDSATAISVGGTFVNHDTGITVENGTFEGESNVFLNNDTDVRQTGTGYVRINGGALNTTKLDFANPETVEINANDVGDDFSPIIGRGADSDQKILEVNIGDTPSLNPHIEYVSDYSNHHKGLLYRDYNSSHEAIFGVEATNNHAELAAISTGANAHTKETELKLSSQTDNTVANSRWWELQKDTSANNFQFNLDYWDGTTEHHFLRVNPSSEIVWNDDGDDVDFRVESDTDPNAFVIDSTDDQIGLGILDPASKLHSYENNSNVGSNAGITIENDGDGDSILQFLLTTFQRWVVGIDNSDADKFKISSSLDLDSNTHFTIDTSGNTGIGTTAPNERLEVNNTIVHSSEYNNGVSGTTATIDWSNGNYQTITLDTTGGTLNFTNPSGTGDFVLRIIQDGTGARTITTWDTDIKWSGAVTPTLSIAANSIDLIRCMYNESNYFCSAELNFQ